MKTLGANIIFIKTSKVIVDSSFSEPGKLRIVPMNHHQQMHDNRESKHKDV